jgi:hypothetical protein
MVGIFLLFLEVRSMSGTYSLGSGIFLLVSVDMELFDGVGFIFLNNNNQEFKNLYKKIFFNFLTN